MKIDVSVRPQFDIRFTRPLVEFLHAQAALHYDGECRHLASKDGMLTKVKRILDTYADDLPEYGYPVDFRTLDLLSKVVEMNPTPMAAEVWTAIGRAASHYNQNCASFPNTTVESNPA